MPALAKKTPRLIAKIAEMRRAGKSMRQISRETKVSDVTIGKWLEEFGLGDDPKTPAKETRGSKVKEKAQDALTRALRASASHATGQEGIAAVRARLAGFSALVTEFTPLALAGEINPQAVSTISNLEIRYAKELAELEERSRPPAETKPETQPENLEAAAATRRMVEARVARLELKLRCVHCQRHPFH